MFTLHVPRAPAMGPSQLQVGHQRGSLEAVGAVGSVCIYIYHRLVLLGIGDTGQCVDFFYLI